ncbi:hypothetical protein HMPREF3033_00065, partial [Veillonellaceae bacterium DNF00751]
TDLYAQLSAGTSANGLAAKAQVAPTAMVAARAARIFVFFILYTSFPKILKCFQE